MPADSSQVGKQVRWYHLILSAYGFWLPNDPRGSWSDFVGAWELLRFGGPTKVSDRRSYARDPHDRQLRLRAKSAMKFPAVRFNSVQRHAIAAGFSRACLEAKYRVHACYIGHDHAHLVIARHARTIEQIARHLKSRASGDMTRAGCHPLSRFTHDGETPSPWAVKSWSVFIFDEAHLRTAIAYVERHPKKEGLPDQSWDFVTPPFA